MADVVAIALIVLFCTIVVLLPIVAVWLVTKPRRRRIVAQPPSSAASWDDLQGRTVRRFARPARTIARKPSTAPAYDLPPIAMMYTPDPAPPPPSYDCGSSDPGGSGGCD